MLEKDTRKKQHYSLRAYPVNSEEFEAKLNRASENPHKRGVDAGSSVPNGKEGGI